ncbi:MAG: ribonuclease HII [Oligoflexia bacterium]|nr:ribonuclease HII [Oligoflexia bacterium]
MSVAGVDEVGRGCLAGPVVAGAVILPAVIDYAAYPWLADITDSKNLSPKAREQLAPLIEGWAVGAAVGHATVEEIDRINIYHASHLAMERAVAALGVRVEHVLVDGNAIPKALRCPSTAIVKGDLKCLSIAAASIIAKVWRDRLLTELDARYPGYGFAIHKGYGTPAHLEALKSLGACAVHRRSFAPVAAVTAISTQALETLPLL